jgi:hypothetical protein
MIKKQKNLLIESGIRDIKDLANRYRDGGAKIYFHQDLDGVTTALAMKKYLERYGIETVDAEVIQYGTSEFAIKKPDASGKIMPVLVDFAHGKPMFLIHTDHHDTQAGAEFTKSKQFSHSRSNVKTVSDVISPNDLFYGTDIQAISTIDSADFIRYNITPQDILNFNFKNSSAKNRFMLMFIVNKWLLTFKSKDKFLETLVLECTPSAINLYLKIKELIGGSFDEKSEELLQNQIDYIEDRKTDKDIDVEDKIIFQYGLGYIGRKGSYDRYTPFINNPEGDFLITAFPIGMVQVSCNPFKTDRALKGVNLGEVKDEVLSEFETELKNIKVSLSSLKWISESDPGFTEESIGFTYRDLKALYGNDYVIQDVSEEELQNIMNQHFNKLSEKDKEILDGIYINGWDIVLRNSGGHRCITNISGLNYLVRPKRPPKKEQKAPKKTNDEDKIIKVDINDLIIENIELNTSLFKMKRGKKQPLDNGSYYIDTMRSVVKVKDGVVVKITKYNPFGVKKDETPYVGFVKRIAESFKARLIQMIQSENVNENYFRNLINKVIRG